MDSRTDVLTSICDAQSESDRNGVGAEVLACGVLVGQTYRLRRKISTRGACSTWEADDLCLARAVAVKFLAETPRGDDVRPMRFERAMRSLARLRTAHVAEIYEHGRVGRTPYIVTELLRGEGLQARLERVKRLPLASVAKIVDEAGNALREAHSIGIVHRDLKPRSLFLASVDGNETTKIVDFGVATSSGTVESRGSPEYLSPEQLCGEPTLDGRADLWALGVVVYRALTGVSPFQGDRATVIRTITERRLRAPSAICPDLPRELDAFTRKALAADRSERFQTASELVEAFRAVL